MKRAELTGEGRKQQVRLGGRHVTALGKPEWLEEIFKQLNFAWELEAFLRAGADPNLFLVAHGLDPLVSRDDTVNPEPKKGDEVEVDEVTAKRFQFADEAEAVLREAWAEGQANTAMRDLLQRYGVHEGIKLSGEAILKVMKEANRLTFADAAEQLLRDAVRIPGEGDGARVLLERYGLLGTTNGFTGEAVACSCEPPAATGSGGSRVDE